MQWLTTAPKRRLLFKNVAPDIARLLAQGKNMALRDIPKTQ